MKTLLPRRMETVIVTMHALQMKEQPIKLETIANMMNKDEMDLRATSNVMRELQSRELVVKIGNARRTIYHLTKKAMDAIENKSLASVLQTKPIQKTKAPIQQNKISPIHVNFMKQMNQFLKDHENLIQENKSLREENKLLKDKISQIKNLFNI